MYNIFESFIRCDKIDKDFIMHNYNAKNKNNLRYYEKKYAKNDIPDVTLGHIFYFLYELDIFIKRFDPNITHVKKYAIENIIPTLTPEQLEMMAEGEKSMQRAQPTENTEPSTSKLSGLPFNDLTLLQKESMLKLGTRYYLYFLAQSANYLYSQAYLFAKKNPYIAVIQSGKNFDLGYYRSEYEMKRKINLLPINFGKHRYKKNFAYHEESDTEKQERIKDTEPQKENYEFYKRKFHGKTLKNFIKENKWDDFIELSPEIQDLHVSCFDNNFSRLSSITNEKDRAGIIAIIQDMFGLRITNLSNGKIFLSLLKRVQANRVTDFPEVLKNICPLSLQKAISEWLKESYDEFKDKKHISKEDYEFENSIKISYLLNNLAIRRLKILISNQFGMNNEKIMPISECFAEQKNLIAFLLITPILSDIIYKLSAGLPYYFKDLNRLVLTGGIRNYPPSPHFPNGGQDFTLVFSYRKRDGTLSPGVGFGTLLTTPTRPVKPE